VIVLGLSFYTVVGSLIEQDLISISKSFLSKHEKPASILLIIIGSLFGFLWLSEIIPALISASIPKSLINTGLWVNPIHVIDLAILLPAMIITGIFLTKKKSLGRLFAAPWLTFSTLMGSSIVANMIIELVNGNNNTIVPLIMIGIITISSAITLNLYFKKI
jgi:asparagine N-glycosylation enzyme membrane subunit Stt3